MTPQLTELAEAWTEYQKFGMHEGECTFAPSCTECGTPQGKCDLHAENFRIRNERMQAAITSITAPK